MPNRYVMYLLGIILVIVPVRLFGQSAVLDRVVAVVNGEIITLSDIRTEKTMREILREPPAKDDREVLDELIDQRLIHSYLRQYPRANPTEAELDEELSQIKDHQGLRPETIREAIREHLRVQRFFSERFGQFVHVSNAEIQKYYDEIFMPAARARGLTRIPPLPEIAETIRRNAVEEKVVAEVKKWLEHARRTANIQVFN
jgi:parvulin-like peptidyl-prolyl isomerase